MTQVVIVQCGLCRRKVNVLAFGKWFKKHLGTQVRIVMEVEVVVNKPRLRVLINKVK
jgi:hypothetical protein